MKELTYESIVHVLELKVNVIKQELQKLTEMKSLSLEKLGRMIVLENDLNYHKMLKEACEKQASKKPIEYDGTSKADCPVCKNIVRGIGKPWGNWCAHCGRKLDWRKE